MKNFRIRFCRYAVCVFSVCLALAAVVFAGPPLICHSFDIGDAKSIFWTSHDWNLTGSENYNTKNLAADTITVTMKVMVRTMMVLRRSMMRIWRKAFPAGL